MICSQCGIVEAGRFTLCRRCFDDSKGASPLPPPPPEPPSWAFCNRCGGLRGRHHEECRP